MGIFFPICSVALAIQGIGSFRSHNIYHFCLDVLFSAIALFAGIVGIRDAIRIHRERKAEKTIEP